MFDTFMQRLGWWCNALWPEADISTNELIFCPDKFSLIIPNRFRILPSSWIPPPQGYLKFNTDGAVKGSYGDAGIGGCLRNDKSQCLISFSNSVGISDVTTTEIRALVEAC
ncbi:hypothetical protein V6N11_077238 [Hibiscus sabdariffa]|uniref:RNase H type-1 domain-containing protein n=1 Tax=Hibiscus sabdariffa TaxID=183260 RepID=A0ABR2TCH3_9ROSI